MIDTNVNCPVCDNTGEHEGKPCFYCKAAREKADNEVPYQKEIQATSDRIYHDLRKLMQMMLESSSDNHSVMYYPDFTVIFVKDKIVPGSAMLTYQPDTEQDEGSPVD